MKKICIVMLIMAASAMVSATPYYGWQSEETVDAQTRGLFAWNNSSGDTPNLVGGVGMRPYGAMSYAIDGGKFGNGASCPGGTASADGWLGVWDEGNTRKNVDALGPDASLSVALWIKPNVLPTARATKQILVDKAYSHTPTAGYQMYLYYDTDNQIYLKTAIGTVDGTSVRTIKAISFVSGQWTHLAMVWDSSADTLNIYQDGILLESTLSAGSVYAPSIAGSTNSQSLRIGNHIASDYGTFSGVIDDLKISEAAIEYATPEPATIAMLSISLLMLKRRK